MLYSFHTSCNQSTWAEFHGSIRKHISSKAHDVFVFFISGNWRNAHYSDVENYDIKKEQKITGQSQLVHTRRKGEETQREREGKQRAAFLTFVCKNYFPLYLDPYILLGNYLNFVDVPYICKECQGQNVFANFEVRPCSLRSGVPFLFARENATKLCLQCLPCIPLHCT